MEKCLPELTFLPVFQNWLAKQTMRRTCLFSKPVRLVAFANTRNVLSTQCTNPASVVSIIILTFQPPVFLQDHSTPGNSECAHVHTHTRAHTHTNTHTRRAHTQSYTHDVDFIILNNFAQIYLSKLWTSLLFGPCLDHSKVVTFPSELRALYCLYANISVALYFWDTKNWLRLFLNYILFGFIFIFAFFN